jgi:hypothetical protein
MRPILALIMLAAMVSSATAQTPLQKCKVITEAIERLQCYDAIEETPTAPAPAVPAPAARPAAPAPAAKTAPAPAAKAAPEEDPLITQAKASVVD